MPLPSRFPLNMLALVSTALVIVTIYENYVIRTDSFSQSNTVDLGTKLTEADSPQRLPGYTPDDLSSASIHSSRPPTWDAPIVGPTWLRAGRDKMTPGWHLRWHPMQAPVVPTYLERMISEKGTDPTRNIMRKSYSLNVRLSTARWAEPAKAYRSRTPLSRLFTCATLCGSRSPRGSWTNLSLPTRSF